MEALACLGCDHFLVQMPVWAAVSLTAPESQCGGPNVQVLITGVVVVAVTWCFMPSQPLWLYHYQGGNCSGIVACVFYQFG